MNRQKWNLEWADTSIADLETAALGQGKHKRTYKLKGLEREKKLQPELLGPGVYLIYADSVVVYIGMSKVLIKRLGMSIKNAMEIYPNISVGFIPTKTVDEAYKLENKLISWLGPAMNKQCI
ncbi:MAG: hypothetical protein ACXAEN_21820 [Candidatus Thorarchaeota archaeon]|jgi:hypothetical protein